MTEWRNGGMEPYALHDTHLPFAIRPLPFASFLLPFARQPRSSVGGIGG